MQRLDRSVPNIDTGIRVLLYGWSVQLTSFTQETTNETKKQQVTTCIELSKLHVYLCSATVTT